MIGLPRAASTDPEAGFWARAVRTESVSLAPDLVPYSASRISGDRPDGDRSDSLVARERLGLPSLAPANPPAVMRALSNANRPRLFCITVTSALQFRLELKASFMAPSTCLPFQAMSPMKAAPTPAAATRAISPPPG